MSNAPPHRSFALLLLGLLACGSDAKPEAPEPATPERACSSLCEKLETCSDLEGLSKEDCVRGCSAAASGEAQGCSVSSAEAGACIDALRDVACTQISSSEVPAACSWCEQSSPRTRAGAGAVAAGSGAAASGSGCEPLRTCCGQISASDQQSLCNMVVTMNNPGLCAAVLPGYRSAGICK